MPLSMQVKILRALQERQIERVGGVKSIAVDVRIVAATHQNLETMVAEGRFRQDLFYRLQGVTLRLPPLRERVDDLPTLVGYLLERAAQRLWRTAATVTAGGDAVPLDVPVAGQCPGAAAHARGGDGALRRRHHARAPAGGHPEQRGAVAAAVDPIMKLAGGSLDDMLEESERRMILDALGKAGGVQARAAKILGISERSLWYRVKKLNIPTRPGEEDRCPELGGRGRQRAARPGHAPRRPRRGAPGARPRHPRRRRCSPSLAYRAALHVIDRLLRPLEGASDYPAKVQRARTLGPLMTNAIRYTLTFVALVVVLREVGVDVQALLVSAGVLGLAVGLGAQSLIKDVITGFFILFEGLIGVGDVIEVGGHRAPWKPSGSG